MAGVFDKLGDLARVGITQIQDLNARRHGDSLSQLSDRELEDELLRRRRERAEQRATGDTNANLDTASKGPRTPQEQQLAQYFANLELRPGATLEDVRRAYREMMRKYHPDKHIGDPERHKAATELAQSLTKAYQELTTHFGHK